MAKEAILSFIEEIDELRAIPVVVMELMSMLNEPETPVEEIAGKIKEDEAISAFVLKCCNSAHYGIKTVISTVSQGLIMLGYFRYKSILMSYFLRQLHQKINKKYIANYLWEHSICVALTARELAIHAKLKKDHVEEVYMAGLLHDIGKLAFYFSAPEAYETLIQVADKERLSILPIEESSYGYNHAAVGFHLLTKWRLPKRLSAPAFYHHNIEQSRDNSTSVKLVTFANTLTHAEIGKRAEISDAQLDVYGLTKIEYNALVKKMFDALMEAGLIHLE